MHGIFFGSSWWSTVLAWWAVLAALSYVARRAVRRVGSAERGTELADFAGKVLSPFGATFAFLIGFAASMTWSAINAGQEAVDAQVSSAQQLAWATKSIDDRAGAAAIIDDLRRYLDKAANDDPALLAEGRIEALPSAVPFDTLQHTVHAVAYHQASGSEAGAMTSAAATLTATAAKISAVSQRSLPPLLIGLIVVTSGLLAVTMGISAAEVTRPHLMFGWALVAAIALTLVFTLDVPFRGAIKVNLHPLGELAQTLSTEPLSK